MASSGKQGFSIKIDRKAHLCFGRHNRAHDPTIGRRVQHAAILKSKALSMD